MNFSEIVSETMDRLNLTSTTATTRVGKMVNDRLKRLTSSIGLETSRRLSTSTLVTVGSNTLTFPGVEKILAVFERLSSTSKDTMLNQLTADEMHVWPVSSQPPRNYAITNMHTNSVSIMIDCIPTTAFTLYADGQVSLITLSGTMSPDFSESYHDILVFGAMADEYRKMEKLALMQDAEANYERRLSDLRMWIAKNGYLDLYPGKLIKTGRWPYINRNQG